MSAQEAGDPVAPDPANHDEEEASAPAAMAGGPTSTSTQTLVAPGVTAVLGPGVLDGVLHQIRAAIVNPDPLGSVLLALATVGRRNLPSFGFAFQETSDARLLLRGTVSAAVRTVNGDVLSFGGRDVATWTEHSVHEPAEVALLHNGEPLLTALSGGTAVPAAPLPPATGRHEEAAEAELPDIHTPAGSEAPPAPKESGQEEVEGEEFDFSHLLADTRFHDVESAAVRPPEEQESDDPASAADGASGAAPGPVSISDNTIAPTGTTTIFPDESLLDAAAGATSLERHPAGSGRREEVAAPGGLIDGFPGRNRPAPAPDEPTAADPTGGIPGPDIARDASAAGTADGEGSTISLAELRSRLGENGGPARPDIPVGPRVQAVLCVNGHPNPPHAPACRSCAGPILDRTVTIVVRPPLGFLRFEDDNVVELDRPALIGRRPVLRTPAPANATLPRLVTLPDPEKMLSRTHLEVRLDDWRVAVVDHDSRNGSTVEIPGLPPTKLRPGELCVITLGTRVTLGEVVRFSYETGTP